MRIKGPLKWLIITCVLVLLLSVLVILSSCLIEDTQDGGNDELSSETRVLFIGNSYTFFNNLPQIFSNLAEDAGHQISVEMLAQGGWTLQKHAQSKDTLDKIQGGGWDYVVLQEQSVLPSIPEDRQLLMYPAIRQLTKEIEGSGAQGVLFMTWGRRPGGGGSQADDFNQVQAELEYGYLEIADELELMVAPVGIAWRNALEQNPQLDLWAADGSHPSLAGSYLSACVFYALIFGESPVGLIVPAGLDEETGQFLQSVGAETVFEDLERWNIE
jgi:hypothetical protein